jgi:hypothetical protein
MPDPSPQSADTAPTRSQICDEVGRAVGSLWQRRSGVRPASVSTEYVDDVVRCTIEGGDGSPEGDEAGNSLLPRAYELEARAAVVRLTGRDVKGYIDKAAKGDSAATNAFILERARIKY